MTRSRTFSPAAETTTPPRTFGPVAPRHSPPGLTSPASPWLHNRAYRRASLSPSRFRQSAHAKLTVPVDPRCGILRRVNSPLFLHSSLDVPRSRPRLGQQLCLADFDWRRRAPRQSRSYALFEPRRRGTLGRDVGG